MLNKYLYGVKSIFMAELERDHEVYKKSTVCNTADS